MADLPTRDTGDTRDEVAEHELRERKPGCLVRLLALFGWMSIVVAVFALGSLPRSFVAERACNSWGEPQGLVLDEVTTGTPGTARRPGASGSCDFTAPDGSDVFVGLDEVPTPVTYHLVNAGTVVFGGAVIIFAAYLLATRAGGSKPPHESTKQ